MARANLKRAGALGGSKMNHGKHRKHGRNEEAANKAAPLGARLSSI
jgi:hypothetical protein